MWRNEKKGTKMCPFSIWFGRLRTKVCDEEGRDTESFDALKRADKREKELGKELSGQSGGRNANKDELAKSSYRVLAELPLLTDVEAAPGRRFIDGAYEWIGDTISDNSAMVECGFLSMAGLRLSKGRCFGIPA